MKTFRLLPLLFLWSIGGLFADAQIAAVQEILKSRGFYHGEVNGENNNETAAAITRFQVRGGLEVTGALNEETLRLLGLQPVQAVEPNAEAHSQQRIEAWRALRERDREFLRQTTSSQPTDQGQEQILEVSSIDQVRDFVAGFVVAGIGPDVEAELQFYAEKADYYDSGYVSKDFIRKDILRYNQKWPLRRYWLEGDVNILNALEADPIEVRYQIRYSVKSAQKERSGTAIKTLKLQKTRDGLEITSVREKTLN
jgi:peptidoglycan hydrolase-like protein with peptidoglycan-binding domain